MPDIALPTRSAAPPRSCPAASTLPCAPSARVGGEPFFVERAAGSRLWDVDGNEYIDYVLSWGPLDLRPRAPGGGGGGAGRGGAGDLVRRAHAARRWSSPSWCASSSPPWRCSASSTAAPRPPCPRVRVARGFTGPGPPPEVRGLLPRPRRLLPGEGGLGRGHPRAPQLARACRRSSRASPSPRPSTTWTRWRRSSRRTASRIAAVIVEPVVGNARLHPAAPTTSSPGCAASREEDGALLVFDEVMTGFRVSPGRRAGALRRPARPHHAREGDRRRPAGGRLRRPARDHGAGGARSGPIYQAGTLSGNPLAMAAGLAQLRLLRETDPYPELERRTAPAGRGAPRQRERAGRSRHRREPRLHVGDLLRRRPGDVTSPRRSGATWSSSAATSTAASSAASSSRPRPSRRASLSPPTRMRTSKRRSSGRARRSARRWR